MIAHRHYETDDGWWRRYWPPCFVSLETATQFVLSRKEPGGEWWVELVEDCTFGDTFGPFPNKTAALAAGRILVT
ncbi:hypothetical protein [Paraburkholderia unamae]|uniref:Uncharacterized protein n=1 Tax=Paraburkholderia unamae TaxID=219649 RepID=A0ACC6RH69_9BURK